jgi:hypothetical protein
MKFIFYCGNNTQFKQHQQLGQKLLKFQIHQINNFQNNKFLLFLHRTPPVVPARKHSRAGVLPDRPPQRPPKPSGGRRHSDDNRSMSDASPTIEDDLKKENTEWYEYGCV